MAALFVLGVVGVKRKKSRESDYSPGQRLRALLVSLITKVNFRTALNITAPGADEAFDELAVTMASEFMDAVQRGRS